MLWQIGSKNGTSGKWNGCETKPYARTMLLHVVHQVKRVDFKLKLVKLPNVEIHLESNASHNQTKCSTSFVFGLFK